MNKLFMVALGGKVKHANIEVHDVQFVIGDTIEDTYKSLEQNWYGLSHKLHLDSYKHIEGADGYKISILENQSDDKTEHSEKDKSLFLVNIGGYDPKSLLEIHRIGLYVAISPGQARTKAKDQLFKEDVQQHIDNVVDVSESLNHMYGNRYTFLLEESETEFNTDPDWFGYRRILN